MASSKSRSSASGSGGFLKFFLGFLFAFVVLFVGAWVYLQYGNPPVATADKPFPLEAQIVRAPIHARIDHEMQQPPFGISEDVYESGAMAYKLQCASCHGAQGRGSPSNYPPLAGNPSIQMQSAVNPIRMVLNGGYPPGTAQNPMPFGMPPFAQNLGDDEVAAVVTYIRSSWGNRGAAISARDANQLRTAPLD